MTLCVRSVLAHRTMSAITNTPFDLPIQYAKSGRVIYQPHVMEYFLPHEIEPFYSEPECFDPNDDWHWNTKDPKCKLDPKDEFVHWRRWYMNWHTDEEKRQDAEKRVESQRASERLIAALDELKKKNKEKKKNHAKKHIKPRCRILKRQCTASSSHSWMPSDAASMMGSDLAEEATASSSHSWMHSDAAEATPSSPHSWMHEDAAEATPSSPHSWMHEETDGL